MTLTKHVVQRDELMFILDLEKAFVARWTSDGAAADFKAKRTAIPPMPCIPGVGGACRFHVASVEKWLLKHFQKGGGN